MRVIRQIVRVIKRNVKILYSEDFWGLF